LPDALVLGPGLETLRVKGILSLNNQPEMAAQARVLGTSGDSEQLR
jgi:hypothetical protein